MKYRLKSGKRDVKRERPITDSLKIQGRYGKNRAAFSHGGTMSAIDDFMKEYKENHEGRYLLACALAHVQMRAEEGSEVAEKLAAAILDFQKRTPYMERGNG